MNPSRQRNQVVILQRHVPTRAQLNPQLVKSLKLLLLMVDVLQPAVNHSRTDTKIDYAVRKNQRTCVMKLTSTDLVARPAGGGVTLGRPCLMILHVNLSEINVWQGPIQDLSAIHA